MISDSEMMRRLAGSLRPSDRSLECHATLEELFRAGPLSTITILVVVSCDPPTGMQLLTLGRMALEYPAMQKVVVMDAAPPLPIAEYLTSCGVDLVWSETGRDTIKRLAAVVDEMSVRSAWIAA